MCSGCVTAVLKIFGAEVLNVESAEWIAPRSRMVEEREVHNEESNQGGGCTTVLHTLLGWSVTCRPIIPNPIFKYAGVHINRYFSLASTRSGG